MYESPDRVIEDVDDHDADEKRRRTKTRDEMMRGEELLLNSKKIEMKLVSTDQRNRKKTRG